MLNEGILTNSAKTLIKSEMIRQLQHLKQTTPDQWERRVFEALTSHKREDIDWTFEDNQAGYYTWIKSFDGLIGELAEDGYLRIKEGEEGRRVLEATDTEPSIDYSHAVYPAAP